LEQQEKQVASLLTAKGLRVTGIAGGADFVTLARKACDDKGAGSLSARSRAVIRFETGDLNTLDPDVEKKIRADGYLSVAVGACRAPETAGFSRYKIALLFF
jgi:hypothetical protein